MRRHSLVLALAAALAMLGLVAEYFALGAAGAVQTLFYIALLGFVIGVLWLIVRRQ